MNTSQEEHHRRSVRLPGFDYSRQGAYFITIVTHQRMRLFGEITGEIRQLSGAGRIAEACWQAIPTHFPNVELGAYVVMPNHVHGIVILHDPSGGSAARRGTPWRAPTSPATVRLEQFSKPVSGSLASIMRQYKSSVTRLILRHFRAPRYVWQRNYYEHVIRDEDDWNRIHLYIENNILNWAQDEENQTGR